MKDVSEWLAAGHTAGELVAVASQAAIITQQPSKKAGVTRRDGLVFTRIGELLAEPEPQHEWLVDGLLPAGGFVVLVGKPKTGKSTLARTLCRAVAEGQPFLGRTVQQGRVLYLALEEKRSQVKGHFKALGAASDAPLGVFVGASPVDGLAQLAAALEHETAALVAIDPLFRFVRPRDGNDYAAMTAALDPVLALAHRSGACVLVTHHAPKGERADVDAPIGSTAIAGSADVVLVLKRSDRYRTLSSVQRVGEDLPETVVELDPETRAVRTAGTRQEADVSGVKSAIVEYLSGLNDPVDEPMINQHVEGRNAAKREALRALVAVGSLDRSGSGKRGDPYRYTLSRTLVPAICGGQENEKPKSLGNPRQSSLYSCPRDSSISEDGGDKNPAAPEHKSTRELFEV
ncbi:MAG: AAA family ATPase [Candidatus Binatia bacterium]|jgi:hypothetical protein